MSTGVRKSVRFEVLKRDNFTCQYCGKKAPEVVLEVDHIWPRKHLGSDSPTNLITSCEKCNRGKSARPLGKVVPVPELPSIPQITESNLEKLEEYRKRVEMKTHFENRVVKTLMEHWASLKGQEPRWAFESFPGMAESLRVFLKQGLSLERLIEAMQLAWERCRGAYFMDKYFYKLCWNMIRGEFDDEKPEPKEQEPCT